MSPPPKPSKNDIASSATMIDFKSSLPDCGGEGGDEKNIEMSTDCFLCKKCLFTFVPCRMDVTLKKSVLEMGIPLQSSPPHYYSLGVVRRMNFLGNYFGLYFFSPCIEKQS